MLMFVVLLICAFPIGMCLGIASMLPNLIGGSTVGGTYIDRKSVV